MPSHSLPIIVSPEADEDLVEIWGYLARQASVRVADRQLNEIDAACETLKAWPYSGRKRDELLTGMRSVPVYPYIVFDRVRNDGIEIVRVLHGRRDVASIFAERSGVKNRPNA